MAGDASMVDVTWSGDYFSIEEQLTMQAADPPDPFNNSAESYHDPYIEAVAYSTLVLSYSVKSIDLKRRARLVNSINNAAITGWPFDPYMVKLFRWEFDLRYGDFDPQGIDPEDQPYIYNRLEFHIKDREPGWRKRIPHVGPIERTPAPPSSVPEEKYELIGAKDYNGAVVGATNYILTATGAYKDDQLAPMTSDNWGDFSLLWEENLDEIFPGDEPPTFPDALQNHPT